MRVLRGLPSEYYFTSHNLICALLADSGTLYPVNHWRHAEQSAKPSSMSFTCPNVNNSSKTWSCIETVQNGHVMLLTWGGFWKWPTDLFLVDKEQTKLVLLMGKHRIRNEQEKSMSGRYAGVSIRRFEDKKRIKQDWKEKVYSRRCRSLSQPVIFELTRSDPSGIT